MARKISENFALLKRARGFNNTRKEMNEEFVDASEFVNDKLRKMYIPGNAIVVAHEPHSSLWNGRAEYIVRRIEQIMFVTHFCHICNVSCIPLRIGVYPLKLNGGITIREYGLKHIKEDRPCIVFDGYEMEAESEELDDTVAHECGHLLVCDLENDAHGDDFQFFYEACLKILCDNPIEFSKK